jgi:hypothetical protein
VLASLYRLYCLQPYMYGLDDPKRTRLTASVFNGRKICGVFTPGGWLGASSVHMWAPTRQACCGGTQRLRVDCKAHKAPA